MNVVAVLVVTGAVVALVATAYAVARLVRLAPPDTDRMPFLSGGSPVEHAVSRYHVRWYTLTMIFLAWADGTVHRVDPPRPFVSPDQIGSAVQRYVTG